MLRPIRGNAEIVGLTVCKFPAMCGVGADWRPWVSGSDILRSGLLYGCTWWSRPSTTSEYVHVSRDSCYITNKWLWQSLGWNFPNLGQCFAKLLNSSHNYLQEKLSRTIPGSPSFSFASYSILQTSLIIIHGCNFCNKLRCKVTFDTINWAMDKRTD